MVKYYKDPKYPNGHGAWFKVEDEKEFALVHYPTDTVSNSDGSVTINFESQWEDIHPNVRKEFDNFDHMDSYDILPDGIVSKWK
jgi:hypothetical protein